MSNKPLANPNAFTGVAPPWSLTQLDANFTAIQNTINDTLTYSNYFADQSGVANSVIISIPSALAVALTAGTLLYVKIAITNTLTTTITINSLAAKTIVNPDGSLMSANQLLAGAIAILMFDGTNFQFLGSWLSPVLAKTAAETSAGVTPTNYAYAPSPAIDVRRYGFAESASAATNTTAFNNAVAVANAQTNGGWVQLPAGAFNMNAVNAIPAYVVVSGAGKRATRLLFAGTTNFITLGGTAGALYYGTGLSDLAIVLTAAANASTEAVRAQGTQGAKIERLYIEGPGGAGGLVNGVVIDGGNASSFQNHVRDVQCNHIGRPFRILTTGSTIATQTLFENCYAGVSDGGTSIGLSLENGCGNGSLWVGGDFETCGTGVLINTGTGGLTLFGARFESNTIDAQFNATPNPCTFVACVNLVNITDNSGTGYQQHQFIGCQQNTGSPFQNLQNKLVGSLNVRAGQVSDVPLQVQPYTGGTGDVFRVLNVAGNGTFFSIDSTGVIQTLNGAALKITSGSGGPNTAITAPPGSLYLNTAGGGGNTLWVKESGAGNTGWVAK